MQHTIKFIVFGLLAVAPISLSYDLPTFQIPTCFQELMESAFKFSQVSFDVVKVCPNPPAVYSEYDSQKNNILQATTALKAALEKVGPCLDDFFGKQKYPAELLELSKKSLQDAITQLNSLIEEINKATNIADLCKCFKDALQNVMNTLNKIVEDLLKQLPSYVKDFLTGIMELASGLVKISSSADNSYTDVQAIIDNALQKIVSGLNGLKKELTDYASKNPLAAIVLNMIIAELDKVIQYTTDCESKVKTAKTAAELQQAIEEYLNKLIELFQNIFSKFPIGK